MIRQEKVVIQSQGNHIRGKRDRFKVGRIPVLIIDVGRVIVGLDSMNPDSDTVIGIQKEAQFNPGFKAAVIGGGDAGEVILMWLLRITLLAPLKKSAWLDQL